MLNCYFVKLNKGFTLIELMVSLGILVVVILAAMGIYLNVIGTRQKTVGQLNIQEDGQYLMSLIVKDIRAGMVDYTGHGTINSPEEKLYLLDFSASPNQIRYRTNLSESGVCGSARCVLERCKDTSCAEEDYHSITMANISVERLDFYINPVTNPFTAGSITNYVHPRVTVVLKLKSLIEKTGEKLLTLQQTVPQRYTYRK